MQHQKFGLVLSLLVVTMLVSGCSTKRSLTPEKIVTKTEYTERKIQPAAPVKQIELYDIEVMVVSEQNLEKFLEEFRDGNGQLAIIAMSVRGYQNMALNISEMERYIRQQQEVIVYYEKAIAPKEKDISENGPAPTK
jgi:hypothetical protein